MVKLSVISQREVEDTLQDFEKPKTYRKKYLGWFMF